MIIKIIIKKKRKNKMNIGDENDEECLHIQYSEYTSLYRIQRNVCGVKAYSEHTIDKVNYLTACSNNHHNCMLVAL